MPLVHANGLDIHYRISGESSETVVLVNGVGDDLECWTMQVAPLVAAGLRVITFDNRGVGRTSLPPGPYSSREMAADTKALADALGLASFHLVGVSLGGLIAQEYALSYPSDLRSVVLANAYARPDAYTRAAFDAWGQIAEAGGMPLMMRQQAPWVFSPAFFEAQPERLATIVAEAEQSTQPAGSFSAQITALATHAAHPGAGDRSRRRHRHPAVALPPFVRGTAARVLGNRPRRTCGFRGESRPVESSRHCIH
jgi:3-oxoadipate enol-lactonase